MQKKMDKFKTIKQNSKAEIEEKKSRFIAELFYIENVNQAEEYIKQVKKKYFDARHHCYAYRIIQNNEIKDKQSDDGEPSGTAGAPMLNILTKNQIVNVLVIVTRYFGGTLLGTGGLVKAYSEATLKAIENTEIIMQELGYEMQITITYADLEKFKYYAQKNSINIINTKYENNIVCTIEINKEEKEKLLMQENFNILEYAVLREKYIRRSDEI